MDNAKIILILVFVILVMGCTGQTAKNGDTVSVAYSAYDEKGVLIDDNLGQPLLFTIGNGEVVKGFNYAVIGMKPGDTKKVTVNPEEGYGIYDNSKLMIESVSELEKAGLNASIGSIVYATIDQSSRRGVIKDNNDTHALIDFNHPMAGQKLVFDIRLISIESHAGNAIKT